MGSGFEGVQGRLFGDSGDPRCGHYLRGFVRQPWVSRPPFDPPSLLVERTGERLDGEALAQFAQSNYYVACSACHHIMSEPMQLVDVLLSIDPGALPTLPIVDPII